MNVRVLDRYQQICTFEIGSDRTIGDILQDSRCSVADVQPDETVHIWVYGPAHRRLASVELLKPTMADLDRLRVTTDLDSHLNIMVGKLYGDGPMWAYQWYAIVNRWRALCRSLRAVVRDLAALAVVAPKQSWRLLRYGLPDAWRLKRKGY